jgi:hypothetical protein
MAKKPHAVAHDVIIPDNPPEGGVVVPLAQWDRLTKRIEACTDVPNYLPSLAWTCVGTAITALVAAVTLPFSVDFSPSTGPNYRAIVTECCFIFGFNAAVVVAVAVFCLARLWRKNRLDVRDMIIEDMRATRARFAVASLPPEESAGKSLRISNPIRT